MQSIREPDTELISQFKQTLCSFASIIDLIHVGKINSWRERNLNFTCPFTVGHSNAGFENTRAFPKALGADSEAYDRHVIWHFWNRCLPEARNLLQLRQSRHSKTKQVCTARAFRAVYTLLLVSLCKIHFLFSEPSILVKDCGSEPSHPLALQDLQHIPAPTTKAGLKGNK